MGKKDTSIQDSLRSPDTAGAAKEILKEFNEAVRSLADAKNSLERDITNLRGELEELKKKRAVLETDIGKTEDLSEIAMAAKAAEEEKQDALKKGQELRSYLDSAADTIKGFEMKLAGGGSEIKRLRGRIGSLEGEKSSLLKEREDLKAKVFGMNDIMSQKDLKIKDLAIKLEAQKDDKRCLESELESTRKTMDEIQKSMVSIKEKMSRSYSQ